MSLIALILGWASPVAGMFAWAWVFYAILFELDRRMAQETKGIRVPTSFPVEIYEEIVHNLEDCPAALRRLNETSKTFNKLARSVQFQTVIVRSVDHFVHLSSLIATEECTLPKRINQLVLQLAPSEIGCRRIMHSSLTVGTAFADILIHFRVQASLSLSLHSPVSRQMHWMLLNAYTNLRNFTLHGSYPCISVVPLVLAQMRRLESLTLNASYGNEKPGPRFLASASPQYAFLSPYLKEIVLSPANLVLMRWMCSVERGPERLHLARMSVDSAGQHSRHFCFIDTFLERYGSRLAHLYVLFEETPEYMPEGGSVLLSLPIRVDVRLDKSVLGDALRHTILLRQLELLLPSLYNDHQTTAYTDKICKHLRSPSSTTVRVRSAYDIGVDGIEFWEAPFLCRTNEVSLRVCETLQEL